jgi:hypothetical protein
MRILVRTFYSWYIHSQGCIDLQDFPEEKNAQKVQSERYSLPFVLYSVHVLSIVYTKRSV